MGAFARSARGAGRGFALLPFRSVSEEVNLRKRVGRAGRRATRAWAWEWMDLWWKCGLPGGCKSDLVLLTTAEQQASCGASTQFSSTELGPGHRLRW